MNKHATYLGIRIANEKNKLYMRRFKKTKVWSIPTVTLSLGWQTVIRNPIPHIFTIIDDIPGINRLISAINLTLDSKKDTMWNKDKTAVDDIFHWSIIYDVKVDGVPTTDVIYAPTSYDRAEWVDRFHCLQFINRPTAALRDYMRSKEHG